MHIDRFHAKEALLALREVELSVGINYTKAWQGVQIASLVTGRAFEAAIEKAIRLNETNGNDLQNCHPAETESNFYSSPDYIPEHFSVDLKGKEYLIPVACPHRQGRLNCGLINDQKGTITCPLHFSKFEIASGKRISGPAQQSLNIVENNNRVNGT
ncbi:MAG: Rieske (2Fe-2S) protein [Symploca sp. SIO2E6]|nr:Rieske (2Fe-2S) protein [Symploca sp. SIO2E6]